MTSTSRQSDAQALTAALSHLIRVIQFRDRDRACCYGLSVSQCYGLASVVETPELTVNDLAATLFLEKSTASRLVNGLVESGFITKTPDSLDRRTLRLCPTPRGEAVHSAIRGDLEREYGHLLTELDAKGRASLVRAIQRLATGFAARVEAGGGSCCVVR